MPLDPRDVIPQGGIAGLLNAVTGRIRKRQEQEEALKLVFAKALMEAKAKQAFPSSEERLNRLIFDLSARVLPRTPTPQEAESSIPQAARRALEQLGTVAVPGPEGGVVMGQGEVAAGQPSSLDVLRGRLGQPRAQQVIEADQSQALNALRLLGGEGVGRLSTPTKFPSTSTQRRELQISQDFESLREAVAQGTVTAQDAVNALVKDYPELSRTRGKLLEEDRKSVV